LTKNANENDVFDVIADSYSDQINKSLAQFGAGHDFFTQHKAWLIDEVLHRSGRVAAATSMLDVGCGVGQIHGLLKGKLKSITGVDVSAESIRVAAKNNESFNYQAYDGQRLPYADNSFDMAMAICVFHHIPPTLWQQVANEMVRVVRKNGLILIIEHNPFNPVTRYIVNTCPIDKDAVLLSPRRLRDLFSMTGTSGVGTRAILNIPPKNHWLKRLDLKLGWLPIGAQYYLTATKCE
jgi:ubiquinone/menaquinone biosynthesis C-methylase UbiE